MLPHAVAHAAFVDCVSNQPPAVERKLDRAELVELIGLPRDHACGMGVLRNDPVAELRSQPGVRGATCRLHVVPGEQRRMRLVAPLRVRSLLAVEGGDQRGKAGGVPLSGKRE